MTKVYNQRLWNWPIISGVLETRQRGLVIGSGGGCEDFEGFIDELTVYLCRPYYK